jgi:folate-dependent phosphoribosylglycinamide formyltransferase PurN
MIGVLVSGAGTNLQALIDAGLPVVAVASNRKDAAALERARAANIPTATFALDCYSRRRARCRHGDVARGARRRLIVLAQDACTADAAVPRALPGSDVNGIRRCCRSFQAHPIDDPAAGVDTTGVTVHYVDEGSTAAPSSARAVPVEPRATLV